MRHTTYKWFWAWDFEKEEKWLNEMSLKGLQLVAVGFCKYVFEEDIKGVYTYRLELLEELPSNTESIAYIRFLEETGVEYIAAVIRWAYFRKKVDDGAFEIYSDIESKINHYKRIRTLLIVVTPINLWSGFNNLNKFIELKTSAILGSSVSFIVTLLLGVGIFKVSKQIRKLKKEKVIRE